MDEEASMNFTAPVLPRAKVRNCPFPVWAPKGQNGVAELSLGRVCWFLGHAALQSSTLG